MYTTITVLRYSNFQLFIRQNWLGMLGYYILLNKITYFFRCNINVSILNHMPILHLYNMLLVIISEGYKKKPLNSIQTYKYKYYGPGSWLHCTSRWTCRILNFL